MNNRLATSFSLFSVLVMTIVFLCAGASAANAQRRDFMTDAEIELVREYQEIDLRIDVLVKMIDRRFAVLGIKAGGWSPSAKETEKWGEQPKGTRAELFRDIRQLLQKAVDDIDGVAENEAKAPPKDKAAARLFPKAMRNLSQSAARFEAVLTPLLKTTKDEPERASIIATIDLCQQIREAEVKLPPETRKEKS